VAGFLCDWWWRIGREHVWRRTADGSTRVIAMEYDELLVAKLAQRVMGWAVCADRFVIEGRRWLPRWRFQPHKNISDAFRLLDAACPERLRLDFRRGAEACVRVEINGVVGKAQDLSKSRALTFAVARAIGIEVEA
jgi:hypothetical protein